MAALALLAAAMATPARANHSAPATYSGAAASGGTVEFDVSSDGNSVTRFAVTDVSTECGTISSQVMGSIPISNHSFGQTSGPLRFDGSFPATQQAQGSLSVQIFGFPSCTSEAVAWTATTSAPPATDPAAYAACVRGANVAFKKQRRAAQRAKSRAVTRAQKRRARKRLRRAIAKRRSALRTCASLR